jgi:hypothetical protein
MPQIYYGDGVLRETTSSDGTVGSSPIGSLGFYNGGNGSPFEWANGNPLELAPASGLTIFHCTDSKGSYQFLKKNGGNCVESIWVISAYPP